VDPVARVELHGLLRERLFVRLLSVRVVGQFNDGIIQSALGGYALFSPERQSSPAAVVGAFALLLLPYSVIGPFMGVLLDRWRRRQVLLFTNIVRAVMVLLLAWLTLADDLGPGLILVVLVILALNRLILTALAASLPRTVSKDRLIAANAVAPVAGTTAAAIGAAIAVTVGAQLSASGIVTAWLLVVAAAGLLLTAGLSLRLPVASLGPPADYQRESFRVVLGQLIDGALVLVRARPALLSVAAVVAHRCAYGVALLIVIVLSKTTLGGGSAAGALGVFALAIAAAGGGALVGAILTPPVVKRIGEGRWCAIVMAAAAIVVPVGLASLSVTGCLAGGAMLGLAGQSGKVCTDTTIARNVHDDARGRVFALFDVVINVALFLGIGVAGFVVSPEGTSAALIGATFALLAAAALLFVAAGRSGSRDGTGGPPSETAADHPQPGTDGDRGDRRESSSP
jgi:MFS family permease